MASRPITFEWEWQLQSAPDALWPYIADTNRINAVTGLPSGEFSNEPLDTGGSRLLGQAVQFGMALEWEEAPYEWVQDQQFSVRRNFTHGPIKSFDMLLTLEPTRQATRCRVKIEAEPRNLVGRVGVMYQLGQEWYRKFQKAALQIDRALQSQEDVTFNLKVTPLTPAAEERLKHYTSQLLEQGYRLEAIKNLTSLLKQEADLNLSRLQPYALADKWKLSRRDTLEMFLSAAKIGLLNMRWEVMCPMCRGAPHAAQSLDGLHREAHCPACNINFSADFSKNIELSFTPHPQIRVVESGDYCVGGPMVTPHIVIHQILSPGQNRSLNVSPLPSEDYRVRTQQTGVETNLSPQQTGNGGSLSISTDGHSIEVEGAFGEGITSVKMSNTGDSPQRIYVERAKWHTDAVTAAEVTTLQHFRDLFSDEVLRHGEEIGVQGMTILFSDLVGSTAMYNQIGDAPSYAVVRDQFAFLQRIVRENEGAIVKTIGDAIMAAFVDPQKGMSAALAIQEELQDFNARYPDHPLKIKLGMHHGPCIAVNLNGRLDYFGATVNLAARLEGQSQGDDIIISGQIREDPGVAALLKNIPVSIASFEATVKGFDDCFSLFRLTLNS